MKALNFDIYQLKQHKHCYANYWKALSNINSGERCNPVGLMTSCYIFDIKIERCAQNHRQNGL